MAKKINWEYSEPELDLETGEETGNTLTHAISLCYSYVSGKAIVTIDGSESTVKQVKKTPQGIMLVGFNTAAFSPRFFSNQEIESLPVRISGKVVRLIREM